MIGRLKSWFGRRREQMSLKKERGSDPDATATGRLVENVVFHLEGDALEPRRAPWGFVLRNPLQVVLAPKEQRRVNLLVSADVPLLVWPTRAHADDVRLEKFLWSPGEIITVIVTNTSEHLAMDVADGEALACVFPMLYSGASALG